MSETNPTTTTDLDAAAARFAAYNAADAADTERFAALKAAYIHPSAKIAADGGDPGDEQLLAQRNVRLAISHALNAVDANVPAGREASLAKTKLEEALMWAGKGIFA